MSLEASMQLVRSLVVETNAHFRLMTQSSCAFCKKKLLKFYQTLENINTNKSLANITQQKMLVLVDASASVPHPMDDIHVNTTSKVRTQEKVVNVPLLLTE